jgi:hypothetical protein
MKGGKTGSIVIPELEEAAKNYVPRGWSERDKEIMRAYWGRVSAADIAKHLEGNHTMDGVKSMARRMELSVEAS